MKVVLSERAVRSLRGATPLVRKAFYKQLSFLEQNANHPSLQAKKYNVSGDLWQARVNRSWRFYFVIQNDRYVVVDVIAHPK
ncbi:hypothetical protein F183_A37520 [Bryobacterales bacterium F-183]|nr:hypothetical protein F183_A37520 [Bryobacterales bacterium F-183]